MPGSLCGSNSADLPGCPMGLHTMVFACGSLNEPVVLGQCFPPLGNPGVPGLQFPGAFTTSYAGCGFWELQSNNTWVTQSWKPLLRAWADAFPHTIQL